MKRFIASMLITAISVIISLFAGEALVRELDGYYLLKPYLEKANPFTSNNPKPNDHSRRAATRFLENYDVSADIRQDWFWEDPPPLLLNARTDLARWFSELPLSNLNGFRAWNLEVIDSIACRPPSSKSFESLPGKLVFAFRSLNGTASPTYRYIRSISNGIRTNNFGWRGPDITLARPPRTIRIAFAGSSTTEGDRAFPFSYPEFVGHWLNLWAMENNLNLNFEAMNIARSGQNSTHITDTVIDEALPLNPELVVYYEGSNQFWPPSHFKLRNSSQKIRSDRVQTGDKEAMSTSEGPLAQYSAIYRRVMLLSLEFAEWRSEPDKPDYDVIWQSGWDTNPLEAATLPLNLSTILADLDRLNGTMVEQGGELAVTSFFWLANENLRLHSQRHRGIYGYLNTIFYPARYRDIRRFADYQNNIFKLFAQDRKLDFLDFAAEMPQEPDLFIDAIHNNYIGVRVFAWIAFNQIVPLVRARIDAGIWPIRSESSLQADAVHPAFKNSEFTVRPACFTNQAHIKRIELEKLMLLNGAISERDSHGIRITTPSGGLQHAVNLPIPPESITAFPGNTDRSLALGLTPEIGNVLVSILDNDRKITVHKIAVGVDYDSEVSVKTIMNLPLKGLRDGGWLRISNLMKRDMPSSFLVTDIKLTERNLEIVATGHRFD